MVRFISGLKLGSTKNANALYFTQNGMLKTPRIKHVQAQKQSDQAGGTFCHVQIGRRVSDVVRRARRLSNRNRNQQKGIVSGPIILGHFERLSLTAVLKGFRFSWVTRFLRLRRICCELFS